MKQFIETHIPNWKRFCESYNPDKIFLTSFESRMSIIEDEELRISVAKKINVELGILLLAHKEVNESVFDEILDSIKDLRV
jgi:hypothetical protein